MLQVSERSLLYNVSGEAEGDGLSLLSAVPCLQRVPAIRDFQNVSQISVAFLVPRFFLGLLCQPDCACREGSPLLLLLFRWLLVGQMHI